MNEIPTISQIIVATAKVTDIPVVVLLNPAYRARHVTRARHVAQYVARTVACRSWPDITEAFNLAHPSAYLGAKRIEAHIAEGNTQVKRLVAAVSKEATK